MDPRPPSARETETIPIRLPRGTVLGRYAVDGWLRDGGMAALYRGHHLATGAKVAIKVQRDSDEDDATVAARFVREGEVMGRLSGVSNVVQVHDMGELEDGRRYLVMEWVEGDNLEERLDALRNADSMLSIDEACRLLSDVARALDAVHRVAVVHRDVKPSNIMIDRGLADREVAKLLDFGISADLGSGGHSVDLTATGVVLGTSGYAAPEQVLGLPAHPAFDVYALGVVLFESITGRALPPDGLGPIRLPPLGELRHGVPVELEGLVERCMSRDPSRRPESAAEVALVLETVQSQRVAARSMSAARVEAASGGSTTSGAALSPVARPARASWAWVVGAVALLGVTAWWVLAAPAGEGSNATLLAADDGSRIGDATSTGDSGGREGSSGASVVAAGGTTASRATGADSIVSSGITASSTTGSDGIATTEATTESVDAGDTDPSETGKAPSSGRASCRRARTEAASALDRRDWPGVIAASDDRACWSSAAQRLDRRAMRVKAWLERGRYDRCVAEGKGDTEPRVARLTKYCREKIEGTGDGR